MNEQEFQSKLAELMGEISTLPLNERRKLEQLADETRQRHEQLKATVSSLQESLDYLRLSIKYLVFDLEATRRENSYLRKILEDNGKEDQSVIHSEHDAAGARSGAPAAFFFSGGRLNNQCARSSSSIARSSLRPLKSSYATSLRPLSITPKEPRRFQRAQPQPASFHSS